MRRRVERPQLAGQSFVRLVAMLSVVALSAAADEADVTVEAPASLQRAANRIRGVDLSRLAEDLRGAGLALPPQIHVSMIPESDTRAHDVPRWIVGLALDEQDIVIFPERVLPYPYDSVESVFRHETAHLALSAKAGGEPLPRWFHEGVAISVDGGWRVSGQLRLLLEMLRRPGTADLARLFAANTEPEAAEAYGLSAALVADVQRRHGRMTPGAVAARVARGAPFALAFEMETGETPDHAATRAWASYRRWTAWMPALTSGTAAWLVILALAAAAYMVRRRRRARRRQLWDEEDPSLD